jgi:tetratricopeptide (TPR) repeat protein
MRWPAIPLTVLLAIAAPAPASENIDVQLRAAIVELKRSVANGNTEKPVRRLRWILQQDPSHLEAIWQLIYVSLNGATGVSTWERPERLGRSAPAVARLIELARSKGETAFAHYVAARHARMYNAFDRAVHEIDAALSIEPDSTRYQMERAKILIDMGDWTGSDETIRAGIAAIEKAQANAADRPTIHVDESSYEFNLAWAYADLRVPPWKTVIQHYLNAIGLESDSNSSRAYAWNNVSIAYRRLGQCTEALDAVENALSIMRFRNAERNKRYAEFCIEMKGMGIMGESGASAPGAG